MEGEVRANGKKDVLSLPFAIILSQFVVFIYFGIISMNISKDGS